MSERAVAEILDVPDEQKEHIAAHLPIIKSLMHSSRFIEGSPHINDWLPHDLNAVRIAGTFGQQDVRAFLAKVYDMPVHPETTGIADVLAIDMWAWCEAGEMILPYYKKIQDSNQASEIDVMIRAAIERARTHVRPSEKWYPRPEKVGFPEKRLAARIQRRKEGMALAMRAVSVVVVLAKYKGEGLRLLETEARQPFLSDLSEVFEISPGDIEFCVEQARRLIDQ